MSDENAHIRHCLLFCFQRKLSAAESQRQICDAMGPDAVHINTVESWFQRFKSGDTSLLDKPRSGRPVLCDTNALLELVESDPSLTTRCMATTLGCSQSTIVTQLHRLGKVAKLSRWIPHDLSIRDRQRRIECSLSLLSRSRNFSWLDHLITGDEKWCLYVNHTRKRKWVNADEEPEPTPKGELHPRKVLLSVWWDVNGIIHQEFLQPNSTITSTVYTNQLQRLNEKVLQTRPQRDKIFFQHDNARPHTAKITSNYLLELGWEVVPHPPYSPDLAPSDYHLFRSLQNHLAAKQFDDLESLKRDILHFFESKPLSFYSEGIHALPKRWQQVIDAEGGYVDG